MVVATTSNLREVALLLRRHDLTLNSYVLKGNPGYLIVPAACGARWLVLFVRIHVLVCNLEADRLVRKTSVMRSRGCLARAPAYCVLRFVE